MKGFLLSEVRPPGGGGKLWGLGKMEKPKIATMKNGRETRLSKQD